MFTLLEIVRVAVADHISEFFLVAGQPVMFKKAGIYERREDMGSSRLSPLDTEKLTAQAYNIARREMDVLRTEGEDSFAISISGLSRVRISAYKQRGSLAVAAKVIPFGIPAPADIGIPDEVIRLSGLPDGLVLVCGPTSSGKSTTLACLVNEINHSRCCHILTAESPIEYLFTNDKAFISQREAALDTRSISSCLRSARWQSPDVVMISDLSEPEAASVALNLARDRKLVFAAVAAASADDAMTSVLSLFTGEYRRDAALLVRRVLRAILCQRLVSSDGELIPEFTITPPDDPLLRRALESANRYSTEG